MGHQSRLTAELFGARGEELHDVLAGLGVALLDAVDLERRGTLPMAITAKVPFLKQPVGQLGLPRTRTGGRNASARGRGMQHGCWGRVNAEREPCAVLGSVLRRRC